MLLKNGSTDVITYFVLRDTTNHNPSLSVSLTDIDLYYVEEGAAISAKVDATALAAADSAHADNKAYHVGRGLYRIDWPDAAFDAGIGKKVILIVTSSGTDDTFLEVELSPAVDVAALSGDAAAADNAEAFFDGTGYAGGTTKLAVSVVNVSSNVINAAAIATDAIDADSIATDAVTEIQSGLAVQTSVDDLETRLTAARAGYLDNLSGGAAALQSSVDDLETRLTAARAGYLDNLSAGAVAQQTSVDDLETRLTAARAGYLDNLSGGAVALEATLTAIKGVGWSTETLAAIDVLIDAIKAKTDNLPASPAAVGSAMTLTAAYDAAKTAATQTSVDTVDANVDAILSDTGTDGVVVATASKTGYALSTTGIDALFTRQLTEAYAADGAAPTVAQALMLIQQMLGDFSITGTTLTVKKVDGSTTAATFTLNDATDPTSITRAT